MVKKRGLGKSLDALLAYTTDKPDEIATADQQDSLRQLPVKILQRGQYQPRRDIRPEALQELANSIRAQGIIQPIVVRPIGDRYEIIAGERRWRAAQLAGLTEIPAIIRDIPDKTAIAIALIENIQRENLNPIEEASALQRLIEEFGMTHQHVADAVGKSRTTVTNLLRLLALPTVVKTLLEQGLLEMGHGRALITLPEALQIKAAEIITGKTLSVRETENLVRRLQTPGSSSSLKPLDPDLQRWQESLSKRLQVPVTIHHHAKGRGKIIIRYKNAKELDGLLASIVTD